MSAQIGQPQHQTCGKASVKGAAGLCPSAVMMDDSRHFGPLPETPGPQGLPLPLPNMLPGSGGQEGRAGT